MLRIIVSYPKNILKKLLRIALIVNLISFTFTIMPSKDQGNVMYVTAKASRHIIKAFI